MFPQYITRKPAPEMLNVVSCNCTVSECSKGNCRCSAAGVVCMAPCKYSAEGTCHNPYKDCESSSGSSTESSSESSSEALIRAQVQLQVAK